MFLMPLLVTGPSCPKDFQPYQEIILHELLSLYWYGVDVKLPDSLGGEIVNVKVMLLHWVCDYRGFAKSFRLSQSPAKVGACYACDIIGITHGATHEGVARRPAAPPTRAVAIVRRATQRGRRQQQPAPPQAILVRASGRGRGRGRGRATRGQGQPLDVQRRIEKNKVDTHKTIYPGGQQNPAINSTFLSLTV